MSEQTHCRLCGGPASHWFDGVMLAKHPASYFKCSSCGSVQTGAPYWLAEAYSPDAARIDTGAAARVVSNVARVYAVARLLSADRVLDYGGGDGLLCRLLRDYGVNATSFDRYATPAYFCGFEDEPRSPDLVTAFEVLEHLPNPALEVAELFDGSPKAVLASTEPYRGQGSDWWYFAPAGGQHIFFYSPEALSLIASRFGYELITPGPYWLFVRKDLRLSALRRKLLRIAASDRFNRHIRAVMCFRSTAGAQRDYEDFTRRILGS